MRSNAEAMRILVAVVVLTALAAEGPFTETLLGVAVDVVAIVLFSAAVALGLGGRARHGAGGGGGGQPADRPGRV